MKAFQMPSHFWNWDYTPTLATTSFLSIVVCLCCNLGQSNKLRSCTVKNYFWSILEYWQDWRQLKKAHSLTSHFSDQADKTVLNQLCCSIQSAADCKTGLRTHHQGQRRKGKSGNVLTRLQKAGDSLVSTAPFIWDGLIRRLFQN